MHTHTHARAHTHMTGVECWSWGRILSPLDLFVMHKIWFYSVHNHMKKKQLGYKLFFLKKFDAWSVCVHELLCACIVCVPSCVSIDTLPIYSSMAEMYGSYSSSASSQEGQFVLCKKTFLRMFLFFSLRTVSASRLQSWRTSTLLRYWRAMSSSKPKSALNNWNKEMATCN